MINASLLAVVLLFLSGCVTAADMGQSSEPQAPKTQAVAEPLSPAVEDPPPALVSEPAAPAESAATESPPPPAERTLTKDKIQVVQELLRTLGFDPGPIDGVPGPKTKAALIQYRSGCAVLSDILGDAEEELFQQATEAEAPKESSAAGKNRGKEQIRLVQERLKKAGFNPGPIDGVLGAKTKAALEKYQGSQGLAKTGALDEKTLESLGVEI